MRRCDLSLPVLDQAHKEAIYRKFIDRETYSPQPGVEVPYVDDEGNIVFRKGLAELSIVRGVWTLSIWSEK